MHVVVTKAQFKNTKGSEITFYVFYKNLIVQF